jgi:hypothetical protein
MKRRSFARQQPHLSASERGFHLLFPQVKRQRSDCDRIRSFKLIALLTASGSRLVQVITRNVS